MQIRVCMCLCVESMRTIYVAPQRSIRQFTCICLYCFRYLFSTVLCIRWTEPKRKELFVYIRTSHTHTHAIELYVMTYLTISGRRSKTFGCGCFSTLNGDKTTVAASINSVDNSIGCVDVFSSGVYRLNVNGMENKIIVIIIIINRKKMEKKWKYSVRTL